MRISALVLGIVILLSFRVSAQVFSLDSIQLPSANGFPKSGVSYALSHRAEILALPPGKRAETLLRIAELSVRMYEYEQAFELIYEAIRIDSQPATCYLAGLVLIQTYANEDSIAEIIQMTEKLAEIQEIAPALNWDRKCWWLYANRRGGNYRVVLDSAYSWLNDPTLPPIFSHRIHCEIVFTRSYLYKRNPTIENRDSLELALPGIESSRKTYSGPVDWRIYGYLANSISAGLRSDPDSRLFYLEKSTEIYDSCDYYWGVGMYTYRITSSAFSEKNAFEAAEKFAKKGVKKALQYRDKLELANQYTVLGKAFWDQNNFTAAYDQYLSGKRMLEAGKITSPKKWGSAYHNLAITQWELKQQDSSFKSLNQALKFYSEGNLTEQIASTYNSFGINHLELDQNDSAVAYFEKAAQITRDSFGTSPDLLMYTISAAFSRLRMDQTDKAFTLLQTADALESQLPQLPLTDQSLFSLIYAEYFLKTGQRAKAIDHSQRALNILVIPEENVPTGLWNPTPVQVLSNTQIIWILRLKILALMLPQENQSISQQSLKHALETCETAFLFAQSRRQEATGGFGKILTQVGTEFFAEKGIAISEKLYQITQNPAYLVKAFEFSEKGRSGFLTSRLNESRAMHSGGVPDSIQRRKAELERIISIKEGEITRNSAQDSTAFSLSELHKQLQDLSDSINQKYPRYAQLLNSTMPPSISELQHFAETNQSSLVEYFMGDSALYTFVITADTFLFLSQPISHAFQQALTGYLTLMHTNTVSVGEYACNSDILYDALIKPITPYLQNHVVIISHGKLTLLPFGTIRIPGKEPTKFRLMEYLMEKYFFSYHFSCQLLVNAAKAEQAKKKWVIAGFAPEFSTAMLPLPGAESNMRMLGLNYQNAQVFLGEYSSKQVFLDNMASAQIVDIATHTNIDHAEPMNSGLYMNNDSLVYLYEIYLSNISAEMANLESCETGIGKEADGEGQLSLAWGFANAGCKSILMSVWKMSDKIGTEEIIPDFYENLASGMRKDEALTWATRNFLNNTREKQGDYSSKANPFFWGELVLIGNTDTIALQKRGYSWQIGVCGGVLLVLIVLSFRYYRRHKKMPHN